MGGNMSCTRLSSAQACGGCEVLEECFYCYYGGEERHTNGNYCYTSTRAVGLKVMLPIAIILLILAVVYLIIKWRRLNYIRTQQLNYNYEVAKMEGGFAANSATYTFRDDILPYLLPCGMKNCVQFDGRAVQMTCGFGCLLLIVCVILFPLAFFTVPPNVRIELLGHVHYWADMLTGAMNCVFLGGFFCCLSCCFRCCLRKAKQRRFEKHHERLVRLAHQAQAVEEVVMAQLLPPHQAVTFHVTQPMPQSMNSQPEGVEGVPVAIPYLPAQQYYAQPPGGAPQSSPPPVEGVSSAYRVASPNEQYQPLPASPDDQATTPVTSQPSAPMAGNSTEMV